METKTRSKYKRENGITEISVTPYLILRKVALGLSYLLYGR